MSHLQGRLSWKLMLLGIMLAASFSAKATEPESVPGEFLVKLKKGVMNTQAQGLATILGSEVTSTIPGTDIVVIRRNVLETQSFVIESLSQNEMVELVEPNYIYRINKLPNDPKLQELWGLLNKGQADPSGKVGVAGMDIGAEQAWEITTGSKDVIVAVIDTGVDYSHPDLAANMWTNEAEANGLPDVDDDNNGYVDDIHGYDFANNDGDPMDDNAHGSHVAGTIGAKGDDGEGIVGVNWNVRIMGIKFLTGSGGGTLDAAIRSIDYATKMGAHIQSNSWGGGGFSKLLEESIQRSAEANALFVAAAGNHSGNNDKRPSYPASYGVENVMSVAALDNKGQLASFSCYGKTSVHVAAPGVNVMSSIPNGHASFSGTSMATPHVSGIAALVLANEPGLSAVELKNRIIATATPLASLKSKVSSGGLAHAFNALSNIVPPPDASDPSTWDSMPYSIETDHPYKENSAQTWEVEVEGATQFAIHFSAFDTEKNYDKLYIYDGSGALVDTLSGDLGESWSPVINGSSARLEFVSDRSMNKSGIIIDKVGFKTE